MRTLVSIVIPTYKGGARLKRLFDAWPLDAREDVELLVFDDGSGKEHSEEIAAAVGIFDKKAPGCHRYFQSSERNRGIIACVRDLVSVSNGKVILQLDDDVILPFGLVGLARDLIEPPDGGMRLPFAGVLSWRSEGKNPGQSERAVIGLLEQATQLASYCMAFSRDVYDEVGGFDPAFRVYCGDSDFALRVTLAGHPSYRVWWPLVRHEEHGAFKDAKELDRNEAVGRDLEVFYRKWGCAGAQAEAVAFDKLRRGEREIHKVQP